MADRHTYWIGDKQKSDKNKANFASLLPSVFFDPLVNDHEIRILSLSKFQFSSTSKIKSLSNNGPLYGHVEFPLTAIKENIPSNVTFIGR